MCFSVATCCVAIRFFNCAMDLVMMLLKINGVVFVEDDSFDFHNDDNSFYSFLYHFFYRFLWDMIFYVN